MQLDREGRHYAFTGQATYDAVLNGIVTAVPPGDPKPWCRPQLQPVWATIPRNAIPLTDARTVEGRMFSMGA